MSKTFQPSQQQCRIGRVCVQPLGHRRSAPKTPNCELHSGRRTRGSLSETFEAVLPSFLIAPHAHMPDFGGLNRRTSPLSLPGSLYRQSFAAAHETATDASRALILSQIWVRAFSTIRRFTVSLARRTIALPTTQLTCPPCRLSQPEIFPQPAFGTVEIIAMKTGSAIETFASVIL